MEYNTSRVKMVLPEYGRNVQKMVDYMQSIEDKAEKYTKELFLALSADAVNKNKTSLKQLVLESQTPGGTNAYVLQELKKKKFYKLQQKVLNSIFKKF